MADYFWFEKTMMDMDEFRKLLALAEQPYGEHPTFNKWGSVMVPYVCMTEHITYCYFLPEGEVAKIVPAIALTEGPDGSSCASTCQVHLNPDNTVRCAQDAYDVKFHEEGYLMCLHNVEKAS